MQIAADKGARPAKVVVYLTGFRQPAPDQRPVISQKNKTFSPPLTVVVAGQWVRLTNDDTVLHNVFSTSKARPFDLGKPGPGEARDVQFPTPGVIDLYCNIHETMAATIVVLPNRSFAVVDGGGPFRIPDVPEGTYSLFAWGPRVNPFQTHVTVTRTGAAPVTITLTPRVFQTTHLDKFGRPYPERGYAP